MAACARKVVPDLARELETASDPAIRNNVVIVLCDLCVRKVTMATCQEGCTSISQGIGDCLRPSHQK